jgi:hypothetical protein
LNYIINSNGEFLRLRARQLAGAHKVCKEGMESCEESIQREVWLVSRNIQEI